MKITARFTQPSAPLAPLSFYFVLILQLLVSCRQSGTENLSNSGIISQSKSCNIGKWDQAFLPLNLKISSDFNGDFNNADLLNGLNPLEQMAKAWNDAVSPGPQLLKLPFEISSTNGYNSLAGFHDNELGIYKSFNWFSDVSSNALAVTQFYGILSTDENLGTHINLTHADIIINYRDFSPSTNASENPFTDYDLPTIVLHEMGHFLGLCHENYADSIMAPYYFSNQRNLKTFDSHKVKELYLNNKNYSSISAKSHKQKKALVAPVGTKVRGIVELSANGHCRHFINGKLVYEHN
jgi:hypothetical protein